MKPTLHRLSLVLCALATLSGCATSAPAPAPIPPPEAPAPFPAPFRLPETVTPTAYRLDLRIDPADTRFSGAVSISIDVSTETRIIRLHSDGLDISSAALVRDTDRRPLKPALDGEGHLALIADTPITPGPATLDLSWTGPLPETPLGVYRVDDQGLPYVFTQFEPLEARRAFPCFDEPRFKVPFDLSIAAPPTYEVVANSLEMARVPTPEGYHLHRFARTAPLTTYLVAFAVGPFDIVDGGRISGGRIPFRVITPRGKGHLAAYAIERTPLHLAALERWFDIPYPYDKLDFLAVPSFSSSGMENAGLITYREAILLIDRNAPVDDRMRFESIVSHELAHMWFGDLVTLAWWDDLWLNEGFATWMARKGTAEVAPDLDIRESSLRSNFGTMSADARTNSRTIRQPIVADGDIYNAFDGITYGKGAAVLDMLEHWVGPEAFQRGVRSYLQAHAHGIATTADLIRHLDEAASTSRPSSELPRILESFTIQAGVPIISVDWTCQGRNRVDLAVSQKAWRNLADPRPAGQRWTIPVCISLHDDKHALEHCDLLDEAQETWTLTTDFCPTFAHPNANESGYFRWSTPQGPLPLARTSAEVFAGYVSNLRSGIESGSLPLATYVDSLRPLVAKDLSPPAVFDVVGVLGLIPRLLPEAADDPRFHRKAAKWLAPLPVHLDLGKSTRDRRKSPAILSALGLLARDKRVLAEAERQTTRFLDDLTSGGDVSLDLAAVYLPIHIRALGESPAEAEKRRILWTRLEAQLEAPNPAVRDLVIRALGAFLEPELVVSSLDLILKGRLRAQDFRTVRSLISDKPAILEAVWRWFESHFDTLIERLGAKAAPGLPSLGQSFCTREDAARVKTFFEARKDKIPSGLERNLGLTLEGIELCSALRERYAKEAEALLR